MCGNNNGRKITRHSDDYLGQSKRRRCMLQVFHNTRYGKKKTKKKRTKKKLGMKWQNCLHRCQFGLQTLPTTTVSFAKANGKYLSFKIWIGFSSHLHLLHVTSLFFTVYIFIFIAFSIPSQSGWWWWRFAHFRDFCHAILFIRIWNIGWACRCLSMLYVTFRFIFSFPLQQMELMWMIAKRMTPTHNKYSYTSCSCLNAVKPH